MSTRDPSARRKLHTAPPKATPRKPDDHPNKPFPAPSKNMEKSERMEENRKQHDDDKPGDDKKPGS